jgi:hypothetical protein
MSNVQGNLWVVYGQYSWYTMVNIWTIYKVVYKAIYE